MTKCPYCNTKMKEVNREDCLDVSDDRFASIDIVFECPKCGREPLMRLEFEDFYDEDDSPIPWRNND
jgi:uncharacterized protein with PIN domain